MTKKKKIPAQQDFLLEFFKKNPNRDIAHPEIVDWVTHEYKKRTGGIYRDPDRGIRKLHQEGYLIKVKMGVYRYDPDFVKKQKLEDFDAKTKEKIFARDGYKCVICGRGQEEGVDIHADHIKPKDRGGKATVENGQTLCSPHNFLKKNHDQTTLGKRYFLRLMRSAKEAKDQKTLDFCIEVLDLFDKHKIDTHISL